MMPRRWIDLDSDADETERALLAAGERAEPTSAQREVVWQRLLTVLPELSTGSGGEPGGSEPLASGAERVGASSVEATPALSVRVGRAFVSLLSTHGVGFAAGVIATAGFFLLRTPEPQRAERAPADAVEAGVDAFQSPDPRGSSVPQFRGQPSQPSEVPKLTIEQLDSQKQAPEAVTLQDSKIRSEPPRSAESAPSRTSQLREEAALIRRAREQLTRGDLAGATATLAESRKQFSSSLLEQERMAVTIELLLRTGATAEAHSLARAFLRKYPQSPQKRQVERALAKP